jgi:hypothetical protein
MQKAQAHYQRDSNTGQWVKIGPNKTINMPEDRTGILIQRLNGDKYILVIDTADYELVARYRWVAKVSTRARRPPTVYATTMVYRDGKRVELRLHQLLTGSARRITKI